MNQELPRPIRNALAQQARGVVHPSPDVLTSFMERTLPHDEPDRVTDHLALCAECRETVFLASNAAEDFIGDNKELAAALHKPAPQEKPRRRWTFGLGWASAAVLVLLVAGVLIRQRLGSVSGAHPDVSTVASNNQSPTVMQPTPSGISSLPETQGKAARAETTTPSKTASARVPGAVVGGAHLRKSGEERPSTRVLADGTDDGAQTNSSEGEPQLARPQPGTHNAFVERRTDTLSQSGEAAILMTPRMSLQSVEPGPGQWRVSADGHLEHRGDGDGWTRVPINEVTVFHIVSVVGGDVWAGGEGGALFRSRDGGRHWNQILLATSSGAETGTIISIQFANSQQGTVLTAGGSGWSTSDGGATWTLH